MICENRAANATHLNRVPRFWRKSCDRRLDCRLRFDLDSNNVTRRGFDAAMMTLSRLSRFKSLVGD
jgi:hypothetical protein